MSPVRRLSQFEITPSRRPRASQPGEGRHHIRVHHPPTGVAELLVHARSDPLGAVLDAEPAAQQRVHPHPHLRRAVLVGPERVVGPVPVLVVLVDQRHQFVDRAEIVDVALVGKHLPDDFAHTRMRAEERVAHIEEDRPELSPISQATPRSRDAGLGLQAEPRPDSRRPRW